ncbi:hypothetical protein FGF04_08050 [Streptomyces apricus]|uniref:Uncharacterized protein n=1 Tax=Streptomyces apricus TaxID=1828112 RepID=A0A5B0BJT0_9ACTN|nr:hypothetical protein FGF04_08050 [Streptomyces apricus]
MAPVKRSPGRLRPSLSGSVRSRSNRGRGARRIVSGRGGEVYYTDDHYDSFRAVLR